jgi:hypothetical protein
MVQHPMSWGRSLYLLGIPVPGHELVDARLRPAVDESGQQVGEVDLRIDLIQLARLCRMPDYGRANLAEGTHSVISAAARSA